MWIGWAVVMIPPIIFIAQGLILTLSFGRIFIFKDFLFTVIESDGIPLPIIFYFYIAGIWILLIDIILVILFEKLSKKNE